MVKMVKRIISESAIGHTAQGWQVSSVAVEYQDGSAGTLYRTTVQAGCVYGLDETHPPVLTHEQFSLFEAPRGVDCTCERVGKVTTNISELAF